jgi:hypothetical protein
MLLKRKSDADRAKPGRGSGGRRATDVDEVLVDFPPPKGPSSGLDVAHPRFLEPLLEARERASDDDARHR